MKQNIIETVIGFVVIIVSLAFLMFAYKAGKPSSNEAGGYRISARFQNAEGIIDGSDIMLAGIKIGSVESLDLDKTSFLAILNLRINQNVKLPKDSQASVVTSGFLGNKFISITPGSSEDDLVDNDQIKYTQSSVNIEALIGKLMYSK
jgi:phospholipid/cholesterol/gamma-HCH transport system substrate-binding protein